VEVSALADYSIHIRHPMCFQVLKEKLENSVMDMSHSEVGASGNCYTTYGQFLKDLGLIFKNAKTYCALHMEVDEVSRNIYDAAIMFNDLMAEWIAKDFSLEVAEKVGLHAIKSEELSLAEAKAAEERRLLEEADEKYRQEVRLSQLIAIAAALDSCVRFTYSMILEDVVVIFICLCFLCRHSNWNCYTSRIQHLRPISLVVRPLQLRLQGLL
jgi:hypothetical protein